MDRVFEMVGARGFEFFKNGLVSVGIVYNAKGWWIMYLIIGGDSSIGSALSAYWQAEGILHCSSTRNRAAVTRERPYIDLASKTWPGLEANCYDAVVFCAAATKLADCEEHPDRTHKINVEAIIDLASFLSLQGSYLLFLSTNQVFDGSRPKCKVSEPVCPISEYGRQKAEAERLILKIPCSAVLRLTKVIHPDLPLLKQWQASLQSGQPIEAFADMYLSPVSLGEVVRRIDDLIRNRESGIFHLSGESDVSYYCFAKSYFSYLPDVASLIRKSFVRNSQPAQSVPGLYASLE